MSSTKVTDEEFIKAWMASKTQNEVAQRLGLAPSTVGQRARRLWAKGVMLPARGGRWPFSVEQLNALIEAERQ